MKTSKLIISMGLMMALSFNAAANGEEKAAAKSKSLSIEKQLATKLTAPFFVQQTMGTHSVSVRFHINNDFSVVVEEISGTDLQLIQWVQRELEKQQLLTERENIGKSYRIELRFS